MRRPGFDLRIVARAQPVEQRVERGVEPLVAAQHRRQLARDTQAVLLEQLERVHAGALAERAEERADELRIFVNARRVHARRQQLPAHVLYDALVGRLLRIDRGEEVVDDALLLALGLLGFLRRQAARRQARALGELGVMLWRDARQVRREWDRDIAARQLCFVQRRRVAHRGARDLGRRLAERRLKQLDRHVNRILAVGGQAAEQFLQLVGRALQ
jgi:hypothetical protein